MSTKQRRYRTEAEKRRIVEAARGPETSVSVVARRFGVNANLVFKWLKDPRYGGKPDGAAFLPVEVAPPPAEPGATGCGAIPRTTCFMATPGGISCAATRAMTP